MNDDWRIPATIADMIVPLFVAAYVKLMFELEKKVNDDGNQNED